MLVFALAACQSFGPDYNAPETEEVQDAFMAADDPVFAGGQPEDIWWQSAFTSPQLVTLVSMARQNNLDIAEALAQLEAASARTTAARRSLLPQGSASAGVTRSNQAFGGGFGGPTTGGNQTGGGAQTGGGDQSGGQSGGQTPPQPGGGSGGAGGIASDDAIDIYTVSADLSWELDVFGRLRAAARQASAQEDTQAALLADTRRLITARAANAYFTWLEAAQREAVAARNLAAQQQALRLTEQLYEYGEIAEFDLKRQRTQIRVTQAGLLQAETARAEALSALALLTGNTVPALVSAMPSLAPDAPAPDLPDMEIQVALDDPAAVLRRRPDIRAAERQLAQASAGSDVATANLFPQITLTGSAGYTALEPGNLGDEGTFTYSYGPRLSWPIFSYPQLLARVDAADAMTRAALAGYERAVLSALTETDAALVSYGQAVERAGVLTDAQANAADALELAEARYRAGADSLITFLDAQRTALQTEDQYVSARIDALQARVDVHRALAH